MKAWQEKRITSLFALCPRGEKSETTLLRRAARATMR
jgi:hypothetical protein